MSDIVYFIEDDHSYWIRDRRLTSATTFIKQFAEPYPQDYWLSYKAVEKVMGDEFRDWKDKYFKGERKPNLKWYLKLAFKDISLKEYSEAREAIKLKWKTKSELSSSRGTAFHEKMEKSFIDTKWSINPFTGKKFDTIVWDKYMDNESYPGGLKELPDGFYPELLIYDLETGIAGQSDMIWIETIDKVRYVDSDDWKTNEKRPNPKGSYFDMYREPISHLPCSKYVTYSLQSSLYAYMMEKEGFVRRHGAITHVVDYDENKVEQIEVPYHKDEIESMIKYHQQLQV